MANGKLKWSRVSPWAANIRYTAAKLPGGGMLEVHQSRARVGRPTERTYRYATWAVLWGADGKPKGRAPFKDAGLPEARKRAQRLQEKRKAA